MYYQSLTHKSLINLECVIINETELRHELRDKNSEIRILMKKLSIKNIFNQGHKFI